MGSGIRELFKETVSAVTATAPADLTPGTIRFEGDKEYQYVYNGGGASAMVGAYVRSTSTSGYTVTVTGTSQLAIPFGIVQSVTLTTGGYGWVLKRGTTTFIADTNSSFAIGQGICVGTDGKWINASAAAKFVVASGTTTTSWADGLTYPLSLNTVYGVAVSALASAGSGLGYFRIL